MGRKVDVDDLVGSKEIAGLLELSHPEQVHRLRKDYPPDSAHPFPKPLTKLSVGFIWSRSEVLRWEKSRQARRAKRAKAAGK